MRFDQLNQKRKGGFKKTDDQFLQKLNRSLTAMEYEHENLISEKSIEHPLIFVFGLPRSGTTLTAQTVINGLGASYINNLVARFWKTPLVGIRLSDSLKLGKNASFESDYAWTNGITDLHEFGYYWRELFSIDSISQLSDLDALSLSLDWSEIKRKIGFIHGAFDDTLVMKNIYGAYFLPELTRVLQDKPLWIWIQREKAEVATSIYYARLKFYDDPSVWWSTYPPNCSDIESKDWFGQICAQVNKLFTFYQNQTRKVSPMNIIEIDHKELLLNPNGLIDNVVEKLNSLGYTRIEQNNITQDQLTMAKDYSSDPIYSRFREFF